MKRIPPLIALALFTSAVFAVAADAGRLPAFVKVDGVYILDGNEDDMVKVVELDANAGWVRVQTKNGESWVNLNNVTAISPVSKEAALNSELKAKADFVRDGAIAIGSAIDEYASKHDLPANASFKWEDIRKFLKPNTPVYDSGGKDVSGRPYIFGSKIQDRVKVNADTIKECSPVISDPDAYWGKYKP